MLFSTAFGMLNHFNPATLHHVHTVPGVALPDDLFTIPVNPAKRSSHHNQSTFLLTRVFLIPGRNPAAMFNSKL